MSIEDEVRRALQPLINQGFVHTARARSFAAYGGVPNQGKLVTVTVMVNADDPQAYHVDIIKLVLQAGLKVELRLRPNPSRSRA